MSILSCRTVSTFIAVLILSMRAAHAQDISSKPPSPVLDEREHIWLNPRADRQSESTGSINDPIDRDAIIAIGQQSYNVPPDKSTISILLETTNDLQIEGDEFISLFQRFEATMEPYESDYINVAASMWRDRDDFNRRSEDLLVLGTLVVEDPEASYGSGDKRVVKKKLEARLWRFEELHLRPEGEGDWDNRSPIQGTVDLGPIDGHSEGRALTRTARGFAVLLRTLPEKDDLPILAGSEAVVFPRIVSFDDDRNIIWSRSCAMTPDINEGAALLSYHDDQDYLLLGGRAMKRPWLVRIRGADGVPVWQRTFFGEEEGEISGITRVSDGVLLVGWTKMKGAALRDLLLIHLNNMLNPDWMRICGGYSDDKGKVAVMLPDGGFLVGGSTRSKEAGGVPENRELNEDHEAWLLRFDRDGILLWETTIGWATWYPPNSVYGDVVAIRVRDIKHRRKIQVITDRGGIWIGDIKSGGTSESVNWKGPRSWTNTEAAGNDGFDESVQIFGNNGEPALTCFDPGAVANTELVGDSVDNAVDDVSEGTKEDQAHLRFVIDGGAIRDWRYNIEDPLEGIDRPSLGGSMTSPAQSVPAGP